MKNLKILFMVISLFALVAVVGCIPTSEPKTVTSTGTARITTLPDEAEVYIAVETLEKSADVSKDRNAAIVDKIYAALYKENILRENIETEYFNLYEEFDWTEEGQKSKGFKTVHTLKVKTSDFNSIGDIIDVSVDAGATSIQNIQFILSDAKQKAFKKDALKEASADARGKAEAIAEGLNAKIGGIIAVSDLDYNYGPIRYLEAAVASADTAQLAKTEISPGKLEITANVEVTFEIK